MNAQDFLKFLEAENLVPGQLLKKLHSKVDGADKPVGAKSIANYLIKKGIISSDEAQDWISRSQKAREEELVANVAEKDSADTSDLISLAGPPQADNPVVTRQDLGDDEPLDGDLDVELIDAVNDDDILGESRQRPTKRKAKSVEVENVEEVEEVFELDAGNLVEPEPDPLFGDDVVDDDPLATPAAEEETEESAPTKEKPEYAFGRKRRKNQWRSKWPLIGAGVVLVLIVLLGVLWIALSRVNPDKQWELANEQWTSSNYGSAHKAYKQFYTSFPNHEKANLALIRMNHCELRIPYESRDWETVYERATNILPTIVDNEAFDSMHDDLAVMLPGSAIGFSEEGLGNPTIDGKQKSLQDTKDMMELVMAPEYIPGSQRRRETVEKNISTAENNIKILEYQIEMEKDYEASLETISQLVDNQQTYDAFKHFSDLTREYPELESRQPLRDSLRSISKAEADLVKPVDVSFTGDGIEPPSPVTSSVIVATRSGGTAGNSEGVVAFLVDGAVYGVSISDGKILWRKFVGQQTSIHPIWADEERTQLLVFDERDHSMAKLNAADGETLWRTIIGEPFVPPVVGEQAVFLTTKQGQIINIDHSNGEASKATKLPQPIEISPVIAERDPYLYQPGSFSNLYVISQNDQTCQEVYFLGHKQGAIEIPPFYFSGHILVAVNGTDYCNIHVLKSTERGLRLEKAQSPIRLDGKVTTPMYKYGRWAVVMTDRGDMRMLEVNLGDEEKPVSSVANVKSEATGDEISYLAAANNQVYIAGSGLARFKIVKTQTTFDRQKMSNSLDVFTSQPQVIGDVLYHVRRRHGSALVSASAVDAITLEEIWRTDFAAPNAGSLFEVDGVMHGISSQGDFFALDDSVVSSGVIDRPIRASTVKQGLLFSQVVHLPNGVYAALGPYNRRTILKVDVTKEPPSILTNLEESITQPTCDSIALGPHIVVATSRGQVYRVDPANGQTVGAPFQPALEAQVVIQWRKPVITKEDEEFIIADANGLLYLVAADGNKSLKRLHQLDVEMPILSPLGRINDRVFCVVRGENDDKLVSLSFDGEIVVDQEIDLSSGFVGGPFVVGDLILVQDEENKLTCYNPQLEKQWETDIADDRFAGNPIDVDGNLILTMESGLIMTVNPDSGEIVNQIDVGQPLSGNPVFLNGSTYVSGVDGTIHLIDSSSQ